MRLQVGVVLGVVALTFAVAGGAAVAGSRTKAEEALSSVKAEPSAAAVARLQVAKAEDALDRARAARQAGDATHADLLDDLALEWAVTAVDLARAAELEARAAEVEKETAELEARAKRALTLIEQTLARRGKAAEKLQALGVEPEPLGPVVPRAESEREGAADAQPAATEATP